MDGSIEEQQHHSLAASLLLPSPIHHQLSISIYLSIEDSLRSLAIEYYTNTFSIVFYTRTHTSA